MATYEGIWVLAEQQGGRLTRIGFELLTRGLALAQKRGCALTAVVLGPAMAEAELQRLCAAGADRVIAVEHERLTHFLIQPYAACLAEAIEEFRPEILIAGATSTGRTLMPYVAVQVHAGLTADCTVLDIDPETGQLLQTRPAIGGNILATIRTPEHRPQMATVRPHSRRPAEPAPGRTGEILRRTPPADRLAGGIRRLDFEPMAEGRGIQDAEIVVTAGRGIRKAENVALIEALAEALDAAVGATRDVVDRGWMSYPHQVGLSGKTVTPKLYVAVGVSGTIQHLAGMQTSETIVAINLDPDAQIFKVADLGIVADLFDVIPVLTERLKRRNATPAVDSA